MHGLNGMFPGFRRVADDFPYTVTTVAESVECDSG